eukprot:TRINITY_DN10215_c0_g1_i1.p1 TRINITY_DN10215_c0_g1~~TRINITY_DN10215_c0_g1_i1.p1  ORF type:complete len:104 (+),score=25.36 TRINITY_DN10215_c0_g1_i1:64-375(+)
MCIRDRYQRRVHGTSKKNKVKRIYEEVQQQKVRFDDYQFDDSEDENDENERYDKDEAFEDYKTQSSKAALAKRSSKRMKRNEAKELALLNRNAINFELFVKNT